MSEVNPQETIKIGADDEISILIGTVEQIDDIDEQNDTKDVEQQATRSNNVNLEKEKSSKKKSGKDFVVYNLNEQQKQKFPRQRSILVYFQTGPSPTEGAPLQYDSSRNGFVQLVFTILLIMLCTTVVFTMAAKLLEPIQNFLTSIIGIILFVVMCITTFVMHYVMFCSMCSRSAPCKYICLVIVVCTCLYRVLQKCVVIIKVRFDSEQKNLSSRSYQNQSNVFFYNMPVQNAYTTYTTKSLWTVSWSYMVGFITLRYKTVIVFGAYFGTAAIAFVCLLLACTKFDFTKYLIFVVVIGLALGAALTVYQLGKTFFGWDMKPLHIALLIAMTVFNAIMLVIELQMMLQMILGGKSVELGEDDYALGAYMLYTSIINIFLRLLQIHKLFNDD